MPGYALRLAIDLPLPDRGAGARSVLTAQQMRDDLDALAVDVAILFPDHLLTMAALPDEVYAAALAPRLQRLAGRGVGEPKTGLVRCGGRGAA